MPTQEERIAALEWKVTSLELRRMQDERKAQENTPSAQAYNLREINENMTILLGVIGSQGEDIKSIKERLDGFDQRFDGVDRRLESMEQRFTSLEGKLEQVLHLLTTPPKADK